MKRLTAVLAAWAVASPAAAHWVAAWTAAPFPATPVLAPQDVRDYAGATVRQVMVANVGGARLRIRFTNALGRAPLTFLGATVSGRPLRFGGAAGATIPPGGALTSDPLALPVRAFDRLEVAVRYGPDAVPAAHLLQVTATAPDGTSRSGRGPALAAMVEVDTPRPPRLLVAFGDSITEGARASGGSYTGWPERLARLTAGRGLALINAGISGNRLLRDGAGSNALARFDRDVLAVPGATDIILLEGINDIGWGTAKPATDGPISAAELISADRQLIARAHARGLRVIGGTLLPYRGAVYWTPAGEQIRQALNHWIRTSGAFDAVIDFERAVADPADLSRLAPAMDPGDHLHPNDSGYAAMADAAAKALARP